MRDDSHSWIFTIARHLAAYRRAQDWSRETLCQTIVEAHATSGVQALTGLRFDPPTRDVYERQKVNADRIFRWLDDVSKDSNLLPVNFLPSILVALPMERRLALLAELLEDLSVAPRAVLDVHAPLEPLHALRDLMREGGEAQQAVAALIDGATREELEAARLELSQAADAAARALLSVENELRRYPLRSKAAEEMTR